MSQPLPYQPPPNQFPFPPGPVPPPARPQPKLEPLAETKLLMEGLAQANFRGLERILKQRPQEHKPWVFARGQALLLAETGNLLMIRPPHNEGEPVWYQRSLEFRDLAMSLARSLSQKDYQGSRTALSNVANSCNRCHQTFRVAVQIRAFEDGPREEK